jgi:hypothetical protein
MIRRPSGPEVTQAPLPPFMPDAGLARDSLWRKWAALHTAAAAIATLAGDDAPDPAESAAFVAALAPLTATRRRLIDEHLSDLIAVMEPGLAALLSIRRRDGDASASARALLDEFRRARAMIERILG